MIIVFITLMLQLIKVELILTTLCAFHLKYFTNC